MSRLVALSQRSRSRLGLPPAQLRPPSRPSPGPPGYFAGKISDPASIRKNARDPPVGWPRLAGHIGSLGAPHKKLSGRQVAFSQPPEPCLYPAVEPLDLNELELLLLRRAVERERKHLQAGIVDARDRVDRERWAFLKLQAFAAGMLLGRLRSLQVRQGTPSVALLDEMAQYVRRNSRRLPRSKANEKRLRAERTAEPPKKAPRRAPHPNPRLADP